MSMKRALLSIAVAAPIFYMSGAAGQNLVLTDARILDGAGGLIERGSIVVSDGRIVSVAAGAARVPAGTREIDVDGKTVMPGFIDAHRHLIQGDPNEWLAQRAAAQMAEFLAAGFTTVLSAIDAPQILEARQRLEQERLVGPRIFAGTFLPLAGPVAPAGGVGSGPPAGDPARTDASRAPRTRAAPAIPRDVTIKAVEDAARAGFDYIKTVIVATPGGPEIETLRLIVEEGKKRNLPTITHAVSVVDALAAVEAGPAVLVHTPHIGRLEQDPEAVRKIVAAVIPMTSTLAVFLPHFGPNNEPLFRDGLPFPWHTISSAGQGPVNARLLWDAGISYGYGTDTTWPPKQALVDELRALRVVFSPQDIVTIITKNAASSVLNSDEIGTLEPGKLADIVVIDGDPLQTSEALLNVVITVKEGRVVFETAR